MRQLLALERRIQDLENAQKNQHRTGKVTEVKYDKEKKRWYARMEQGDGEQIFKTNWLPWKSFNHGTIQSSIPPRKGQLVSLSSPQGQSELGFLEPAHYDPDNPSPHDQENEAFFRFQKPKSDKDKEGKNEDGSEMSESQKAEKAEKDKDETFDLKFTKDGMVFTIGKTTITMGAKGFKLQHDKNVWEMTPDKIKSSIGDDATHELTKSSVKSEVGGDAKHELTKSKITTDVSGTKLETTSAENKFVGGTVKHDDRSIGKGHTHSGVMPGGGFTREPNP